VSARRLLLAEDEPGLVRTLGDLLRAEGFALEVAADGERALELARVPGRFELVLLDVMLPKLDGFAVCRELRRAGLTTPVLMLTARGELRDRVHGLELGADDYLTKPFEPDELLARIEALLRRARLPRNADRRLAFGEIEIDLDGVEVRRGGEPVPLGALEFELLRYLVERRGTVVTREELLRRVWGFHRAPATRTVDVHVAWLRAKLERDRAAPRHIRTVRGVGYRFDP